MRPSPAVSCLLSSMITLSAHPIRIDGFGRGAAVVVPARRALATTTTTALRPAPFVTAIRAVVDEDATVSTADAVAATAAAASFDDAEELEFLLVEHKPLGCTAEESLAVQEDGMKHVFVSKVVEGGNAEMAGIVVGDVLVGVTGTFNDVVNVAGLGIEKLQAFIAGRDPTDVLTLKVARGTSVMSQHESALVELCSMPEKDEMMEECITALNTYDFDFEEDDAPTVDCTDSEAECMIDAIYSGWGDELGMAQETAEEGEEEGVETAKKPAPWSSRSSPSGTFVRDPKTGKMGNIDA